MKPAPQIIAVRTLYTNPPACGIRSPKAHARFSRNPQCFYCGDIFKPEQLTRDHFVPKSKGGKSTGNIVPACRKCNGRKGGRSPTQEEIERFHKEGFALKF